jgi:hypothetical protein
MTGGLGFNESPAAIRIGSDILKKIFVPSAENIGSVAESLGLKQRASGPSSLATIISIT